MNAENFIDTIQKNSPRENYELLAPHVLSEGGQIERDIDSIACRAFGHLSTMGLYIHRKGALGVLVASVVVLAAVAVATAVLGCPPLLLIAVSVAVVAYGVFYLYQRTQYARCRQIRNVLDDIVSKKSDWFKTDVEIDFHFCPEDQILTEENKEQIVKELTGAELPADIDTASKAALFLALSGHTPEKLYKKRMRARIEGHFTGDNERRQVERDDAAWINNFYSAADQFFRSQNGSLRRFLLQQEVAKKRFNRELKKALLEEEEKFDDRDALFLQVTKNVEAWSLGNLHSCFDEHKTEKGCFKGVATVYKKDSALAYLMQIAEGSSRVAPAVKENVFLRRAMTIFFEKEKAAIEGNYAPTLGMLEAALDEALGEVRKEWQKPPT